MLVQAMAKCLLHHLDVLIDDLHAVDEQGRNRSWKEGSDCNE